MPASPQPSPRPALLSAVEQLTGAPWRAGPPHGPGWWPASYRCQNSTLLRYWHARQRVWSVPAHPRMSAKVAAHCAAVHATNHSADVCWRPRPASWPAQSLPQPRRARRATA